MVTFDQPDSCKIILRAIRYTSTGINITRNNVNFKTENKFEEIRMSPAGTIILIIQLKAQSSAENFKQKYLRGARYKFQ